MPHPFSFALLPSARVLRRVPPDTLPGGPRPLFITTPHTRRYVEPGFTAPLTLSTCATRPALDTRPRSRYLPRMSPAAPALALLHPEVGPEGPPKPRPPKASIIHFDAIIDYLLAHPGATQREVAAHIRRGEPWVSHVMRSDAFLDHYRARRAVLDVTVADGVKSRLAAVVDRTANVIIDRLDKNPLGVTLDQAASILDKASARLGFGQPAAVAPGVNVTVGGGQTAVFVASPEQIAHARDRLRAAQATMPAVAREVPANDGPPGVGGARPEGAALPPSGRPLRDPEVTDLVEVGALDDDDEPLFDLEVQVGRNA